MTAKKKPEVKELSPRAAKEAQKTRNLVIAFIVFAVIVIGLIAYAFLYDNVLKFSKPAATVGDKVIEGSEFNQRVRLERNSYILQYNMTAAQMMINAGDEATVNYYTEQLSQLLSILDDYEYFGEYVLENMINERIGVIEAEKLGITVSDEEVDQQLQELFDFYPNGTPTPTQIFELEPTSTLTAQQKTLVAQPAVEETPAVEPEAEVDESADEEVEVAEAEVEEEATEEVVEPTATETVPTPVVEEEAPEATPYPTRTPYTQELYQENYLEYVQNLESIGVSEETLRAYLRIFLLNQKLYEVKSAEVSRLQEQVWARHILVESQEEAIAVLNRLAGEEDWNTVCTEVTLDQSGQENCGDLGWFPRGQMVTTFEDAAFALEVGETSNPIESSFGWHIIQKIGHEDRQIELDYDYQRLQGNTYDLWFQEVKDNTEIVIADNWADHVPSEPSIAPEMRIQ